MQFFGEQLKKHSPFHECDTWRLFYLHSYYQ